ncbi:TetR/AcrR family transcriptional regulator [Prescottella subtropica]|uniref:TetR/AcrR family transcriptional regulator n=1 Tax=Prescottella subtropica TaxID=2545757 RepID=UPI0010F9C356|nr:TetR/AcrR family transcriptional regulator [Prescottella subtropica]
MSPRTDTRAAILDAAEDLIAARGFDATSTAAIAAAADVPKGLIFYYFPTKPDILAALLTERLPTAPLDDLGPLVARGDPAASLVNLDDALTARDHHGGAMRAIVYREAGTRPDVREHLRRFRAGLRDATVRILQASTAAPIRPGTLRDCADAWVAAVTAMSGTRIRDRDEHRAELGSVARVVAAGMVQLG